MNVVVTYIGYFWGYEYKNVTNISYDETSDNVTITMPTGSATHNAKSILVSISFN